MIAGIMLGWLALVSVSGGPLRPAPKFELSRAAAAVKAPARVLVMPEEAFPPSRRPAVSPSPASAWTSSTPKRLLQEPASQPEQDAWFGEDKLKHLLVSFAATSFAAAGGRALGLGHGGALAVGAGLGAAAGIWKELHDRASGGDVSARDLVADAIGVAAGGVLSAQTR